MLCLAAVSRLALAIGLLSATALAAEREKLLVLDISVSAPELKATANNLAEQLLTELAKNDRFEVIGSSDVTLLLGLERQKQLLGCEETSASCLAELGGALGTQWLISGALTRAGSIYRIDLKVVDTRKARAINRVGRTVESQEELVLLAEKLAEELVAPLPAPPGAGVAIGRLMPWVSVGLGVVAAGGGVGLMASANAQAAALNQSKASLYWAELQAQGAPIQRQYWAGVALLGVGSAAVLGGLLCAWLGRDATSPPPVRLGVGPGIITVGGTL